VKLVRSEYMRTVHEHNMGVEAEVLGRDSASPSRLADDRDISPTPFPDE